MDAQTAYSILGQDENTNRMIQASLYRCRKSELSPHQKELPTVTEEMVKRSKAHVTGHIHLMRRSTPAYYEKLTQILSENQAVLCYIYENFDIFGRYGNQKLKDELKKINFKLGANLSESLIGTNAAVLASRALKGVWVVGEDHYIDALKPYACYAFLLHGKYNRDGIILLITYKENVTAKIRALFEFIESTECIITAGQATEDVMIKDVLIRQTYSKQQTDDILMIVDNSAMITYVNDMFYETFQQDPLTTINKPLVELMPELSFVRRCLENGKPVTGKPVVLGGTQKVKQIECLVDCKPVSKDGQWIAVVVTAYREKTENVRLQKDGYVPKYSFSDLLGVSKPFVQLKEFAARIAGTQSPVLIQGESGTGKELFAHSVHSASSRRDKPFVSINCAAIPKELIGSELFGYVGGAFTGANRTGAKGKFELANGGTLFLDEIGEMPLEMQSVLLRVLEDNSVTRIGGDKPVPVDVRLITATNRDLPEYIREGKFRLDLYYRLNVINLVMIPLRERKEDIPILAEAFVKNFSQKNGVRVNGISSDALYALMEYDWPGNVRELRNTIERCVITADSDRIELRNLPNNICMVSDSETTGHGLDSKEPETVGTLYFKQRKEIANMLMKEYGGNKSLVARKMGVSRSTLYRILNEP